ncbi:transmembrane protein 107-like protein [Phlyctochytrium arcticum]|nr:transmembrane protein 107-like protein [Phlyctochytrium arcticum]
MHDTAGTLLPARFLTTISHFIISLMIYFTKDVYIRASLPLMDLSDYASYNTSITAALALTWLGLAIELAGFFSGITMFSRGIGTFHMCAHTTATIALSGFAMERWSVGVYWWIFGFCSALPALLESGVMFLVTVWRVNQY